MGCCAFELTLNVGIADYCENPRWSTVKFLVGNNLLDKKSAAYHVYCPSNNINFTNDYVLPATADDCVSTSTLFYDVISNLCEEQPQPSLLLISSLLLLAIFITVLSCASPLTWRRFTKLKNKNMSRYLDDVISEDDDVFLASNNLLTSSRNRPSMTRTHNPMCIRDSTDDDVGSPMLTSARIRGSVEFSPNTLGTFEPSAPPPPNANESDVMIDEISATLVLDDDDVDEDGERPPPYSPPRPH